ncbi:MAG TPA: hypothetical protein PKC13_06870 [Blastocatellia bacterium]|nr:hypothetical protein [Blastocatellia bacterium]HMX25337.1 hypothetical protein [Blastocatellia bacterium]HMY71029.1 hypothetical protein [Blastocatellia bacterium]
MNALATARGIDPRSFGLFVPQGFDWIYFRRTHHRISRRRQTDQPEPGWRYGYTRALLSLLIIGLAFYFYFRRIKWL